MPDRSRVCRGSSKAERRPLGKALLTVKSRPGVIYTVPSDTLRVSLAVQLSVVRLCGSKHFTTPYLPAI